jgi:hypothetical protein
MRESDYHHESDGTSYRTDNTLSAKKERGIEEKLMSFGDASNLAFSSITN